MREKPPPEPQQRETLQAAAERRQYFAYLNARLRGEDVKPPPSRKMPTAYWPENQPPG